MARAQLPYLSQKDEASESLGWSNNWCAASRLAGIAFAAAVKRAALAVQPSGGSTDWCVQAPATPELQALDDCLQLIRLEVLGEHDEGSVEVYSSNNNKLALVPNVGRMSYDDLVQIAGEPILLHVHEGKDNPPAEKKRLAEVRHAIAYRAGKVRFDQQPPLGQGLWPLADGRIAIVNGTHSAALHDGCIELIHGPRVGAQLLDFGTRPWVDLDLLKQYLGRAADPVWCESVIAQVEGLFKKWYWRHPADALVATGLVAATLYS